jgi:acetylornithine deacetylase/succinyl-diaminopimelate desuccinylase-like protein
MMLHPHSAAATGAVTVTVIQHFGSAANLNIHIHGLVLDGVYCARAEGVPVFRPAPALTGEKLQALLGKIIAAIEEPAVFERILTHLGLSAQPPPRTPARRVELFQVA